MEELRLPRVQRMAREAFAEYPLTQVGMQMDPLAMDALQAVEYTVVAVSEGREHGLGWHVPADAEKDPYEHVIMREEEAVYPVAQTGVQVDPLVIEAVHCVE
jgi:hypothetical protein